jgi:hypothetical protein
LLDWEKQSGLHVVAMVDANLAALGICSSFFKDWFAGV